MNKALASLMMFLAFGTAGCSKVTEDAGLNPTDDRTYVNSEWGFSITPDPAWGLSVQESFLNQEPNGLRSVQVRVFQSQISGGFTPALLLEPYANLERVSLDSLANLWDTVYDDAFGLYNPGERRRVQVAGHEGIEWDFSTRTVQDQTSFFQSNRFLSLIVARDDQFYRIIGNGQLGAFPDSDFRNILSTLTFGD